MTPGDRNELSSSTAPDGVATVSVVFRPDHFDTVHTNDEAVVTDNVRETALRLNSSAAHILASIDGPTAIDQICVRLAEEFDATPEQVEPDVHRTLKLLSDHGFVEVWEQPAPGHAMRRRYLQLLERALVNTLYPEDELRLVYVRERRPQADSIEEQRVLRDIRYLQSDDYKTLVAAREVGGFWKGRMLAHSHTMVGLRRLENLEYLAARVFAEGVEGDFLEAGVCQGGASIFMRALQVAYGESERQMWVADSFRGLPPPHSEVDLGYQLDLSESKAPWLAFSQQAVEDNFRSYELLSPQVRFLPGWFADSLPGAPIGSLALLRLDCDLYSSTREVLDTLYDKVTPGGFVTVDDYGAIRACKVAVDEFRQERGITSRLRWCDWTGVFWQKEA
jgi:hypothetical protein